MRFRSLTAGWIVLAAASPAVHADSSLAPNAMSFSNTQTKGFVEQARFFLPSVLGADEGRVRNGAAELPPRREEAADADQFAAPQTAGFEGVALVLAALGVVGFVASRRRGR